MTRVWSDSSFNYETTIELFTPWRPTLFFFPKSLPTPRCLPLILTASYLTAGHYSIIGLSSLLHIHPLSTKHTVSPSPEVPPLPYLGRRQPPLAAPRLCLLYPWPPLRDQPVTQYPLPYSLPFLLLLTLFTAAACCHFWSPSSVCCCRSSISSPTSHLPLIELGQSHQP